VDHPAQEAHPVPMDTMENPDSPANLVTADPRTDLHPNSSPRFPTNAHAKPHQETAVPQDPKEPMDNQEKVAHPVPMANQETRDHADRPAQPDLVATQERKELQEKLESWSLANPAQLVHLATTANKVQLALPERPAKLAKMADLVQLVLLEMLELLAAPARLALPAQPERAAKLVHPALATTAHLLVCPLVIKHRQSKRLGDYHSNGRKREKKIISIKDVEALISLIAFYVLFFTKFFSNVPCQKGIQVFCLAT